MPARNPLVELGGRIMTHFRETDLTEIAFKLGGAKKIPGGFLCRCPGHDDKHSSLSLSENTKGALLVSCHAGCSQESVIQALKDLDLWRSGASKCGAGRPVKALSRFNAVSA
jgi:hypothetical protein